MIKNYFKIAYRNLLKHAGFSFINVIGLAIGIAACLVIFLYVHNEITYDQYNIKARRIARITTTIHTPESDVVLATTPPPLAVTLKREYPEIKSAARIEPGSHVIKINNQLFKEENFCRADQEVFSIFTYDILEGSVATALKEPNSIVLTNSMAKKYFGNDAAVNKIIECDGKSYRVTAVIKDLPANTDLRINALLSVDYTQKNTWMDDFPLYTFALFTNESAMKTFESKMVAISKRYVQPEIEKMGPGDYSVHFDLTPLDQVHFNGGKLGDTPKGNKSTSYIFSLLAIFILIIALLNYINLSTAKSTERAKEVGIRKVSGAGKFQLIGQFLMESSFIAIIAWLLAIAMLLLMLPYFNKLLETKLSLEWKPDILYTAVLFFITFFVAGAYPAFVLSGFQPIQVLKGNWRHGKSGVLLRKTLTVIQFAIAAGLIMGTTVLYRQNKYIQQTDLGFNKNQLLNIYLPEDSAHLSAVNAFQDELRNSPQILSMTVGSGMMEDGVTVGTTFAGTNGKPRELMANYFSIDPKFLPTFGIKLKEGRNLSDKYGTDKLEAFLVNEAFVKTMGWTSAIGKSMEGFGHKGKVVGVVKNFYYKSLHNMIEPVVLVYNINPVRTTSVRIRTGDITVLKSIFEKHFPDLPIDYSFFDDIVDRQYKKDKATMSLFNYFTLLAILISCMGLYGLVSLIVVQRTKEISIRKVLGASLSQLLGLLTNDFVKLVLIGLIIALPLAGFAMNHWLHGYAYHVQLTWWMFLVPGLLLVSIALAVISKEIIKAAFINPVTSLRLD